MASVNNMAMYDYNGSMFAFGVVSGLSNVKSVRMYVSTGTGTTYQYFSTEIYDKDTAHINTTQNSTPCFVFNVRTDRDAESGMPKQLNYWVLDENEDGYGRYKFSFSFYSHISGSTDYLINKTPLRPTISGSSNIYYQMHNSLNTPTLSSWDATKKIFRISNVGKYRHIIEIVNKDRKNSVGGHSTAVRDYAYTVLMKNLEGGKYWEPIPDTSMIGETGGETNALCRYFENYSVNALILFDSGASLSSSTKSMCVAYAKDALQSISNLTGITIKNIDNLDTLVSNKYYKANSQKTSLLQNDTWGWNAYVNGDVEYEDMYQIFIRFGDANSMSASDFGGQGRWFTTQWADYASGGTATAHAMIQVPMSTQYESLNHVIHEEICQSLGIGGDNYDYINSIHADPEYCNPEDYIDIDANILRFIYGNVWSGWDSFDFINEVDTPCILFADYKSGSSYYDFDLSKLNPGRYDVYVWAAGEKSNPGAIGTSGGKSEFNYWNGGWDDSPYSIKNKYEITIVNNKPSLWSWTSSNGSATTSQTQTAYTAITNNGYTDSFNYKVWNDMVDKVKAVLDSTGESWDSTYATYNNTKMSSSDKVLTATKFNSLRFNIGIHISTGITDRYTGDYVYGSYFITIANSLNNWINSI